MTDYIKDMGYHLTVEQVAKRMDASPKKVRRLIQRGGLDAKQVDGRWMIRTNRTVEHDQAETSVITLWHGTTDDRAEIILNNGFKLKSKGRECWFGVRERVAINAAHYRAKIRKKAPVVFKCDIDLTRFRTFGIQTPASMSSKPRSLLKSYQSSSGLMM